MEKLLAAALRLFVGQGYTHTSVEQIAEAAGLTKGAVYFYFRSKANLLQRLLDRVEDVVVDAMVERVAAAARGEAAPAGAKMVAFLHGQAKLGVEKWEHVLLLILMSLEFHGRDDATEARIRSIYERLYRAVEEIITLGKQSGEFRDDMNTREQAAIVMGAHDGTFLEWYRRGEAFNGPTLVRALRVAMLQGLK